MVKCKYKLRFYCSPFGLPPFNLFISNNNRQQKQPAATEEVIQKNCLFAALKLYTTLL